MDKKLLVRPKQKSTASERRAPISLRQKHLMVAACIRKLPIYETVGVRLTTGHFYQSGDHVLAVVWSCITEFLERFETLPNRSELITQLESQLEQEPERLTDADIQELNEFLSLAYSLPEDELRLDVVTEFVKQYLEE